MSGSDLRLWAGTVSGATFDELLEAARAEGFTSESLFPVDHRRARDGGRSDADLRSAAAERGVRVAVLDPLARWLPWDPPPTVGAEDLAFLGMEEDEFFPTAEALGVESVPGRRFSWSMSATATRSRWARWWRTRCTPG